MTLLLKRALVVAILGAGVPAVAQVHSPVRPAQGGSGAASGSSLETVLGQMPRRALPKVQHVRKPAGESTLIVKFADAMQMRPQADGTMHAGADAVPAEGIAADEMVTFQNIVNQYHLSFHTAFPYVSADELKALEDRVAKYSNKAQPDLAGMVFVDGNQGGLEDAANALNQLGIVEFAYFHQPFKLNIEPYADMPEGPAPPPADDGGIAGTCSNCGDAMCGDCFAVHPGPLCNNPDCCSVVDTVRPFCTDTDTPGTWDELCVAIANLFCPCPDVNADGTPDCAPGGTPDRCGSPLNGSCFEAHSTGGCLDPICCATVCALDVFCCDREWDAQCVSLANQNCVVNNGGGPTPDLTALQGYERPMGYANQPGGPPSPLALPAPLFSGFTGEGMWLFDTSFLTDHPGAAVPKRYAGLYGLGRQLLEQYGIGSSNGARGRGIKVAVIEWAFYAGHEDLSVTPEAGQTMITIPEITHPDHATACLGLINAKINGLGMNGIAPDAKAYFFPLTSVEQGPREFTAWTHMIQTLGPGDVVSNSYGGGGNLATEQAMWMLIRMAADLGITCCIAAGNDCANLDDNNDFGDSGGVVVGACTPGRPNTRLTFSNFFSSGDSSAGGNGNVVHVSGWGECVPTLAGSGNVRLPGGNWNRSYCNNFNGTSAACPATAGVVACLQGLAKQFYGLPLQPEQIRTAIQSTGFPQNGVPPNNVGGFDDSLPCGPDLDPEQGPNKIGPYPRPERAGAFILNQFSVGFDDAPFVDAVTVIRGNLLFGNKFSIKGSDNNYLVVDSMFTQRKHRPNLPSPANRVTYLGTGQIADIMVTGHTETVSNNGQLDYEYSPPGGAATFLVTEMYDFTTKKWVTLNFETLGAPGADVTGTTAVPAAQRFINQADGNKVYIRQYILEAGGNGLPTLTMRWDTINFTLMQGPGGGGTGSGP